MASTSAYVRAKRETASPAGQSGVGNQAGTAASFATKTYSFASREFQPTQGHDHLIRDDELRGFNMPIAAVEDRHNPTYSLNTRMYPDAIGFILTWALGPPTTTAGNGTITDPTGTAVPTGAYRHVWTAPFSNGIDTIHPPTCELDVAYFNQGTYFKYRGAAVETITVDNPDDDTTGVVVAGPAAYAIDGADPNVTPTLESATIKPFSRAGLSLPTWTLASGVTGAHDNISLTITRSVEARRTMGTFTAGWPDDVQYSDSPIGTVVTGSLSQLTLDTDDIAALRQATGVTGTIKWQSLSNITGSYPYQMWVAFSNLQYVGGDPAALTPNRRIGASLDIRGSSADGTTASETITVTNATSAYT